MGRINWVNRLIYYLFVVAKRCESLLTHSEGKVRVLVHLPKQLVESLDHAAGVLVRADHRVRLPSTGGTVREAARVVTVQDGADQLGARALVNLQEFFFLHLGFELYVTTFLQVSNDSMNELLHMNSIHKVRIEVAIYFKPLVESSLVRMPRQTGTGALGFCWPGGHRDGGSSTRDWPKPPSRITMCFQ